MRIGQKLLLGFLGIAMLTGIVGYVGLRGTRGVFEAFNVIADETAPELIALGHIDALSRHLQGEALSYALISAEAAAAGGEREGGGGEEEAAEELEEFDEINENLDRAIIELEAVQGVGLAEEETEEEEELLEIIKEKKSQLYGAALALINAKKEGMGGEPILALKERLEEAEEGFEELLGFRIGAETAELERRDTKADKLARETTHVLIVVALATGIIAALLGFYISRGIAGPITKLKDAAAEIGKGRLDTKIEIRSRDEIGELAASFGEMGQELKRSRGELLSAKAYSDNIIKSMTDTLIVVGPESKIRTINRAAAELLGYTEEELIGQSVGILFAEEESLFKGTRLQQFIEAGSLQDHDITYKTKTGQKIPMSFSGSVMRDKDGKLMGVVGVARDMRMTEQLIEGEKELEARAAAAAVMEREAAKLQKAYAELAEKTGRLQRFQKVTVGRELKMVTLKEEINALREQFGQPKKYESPKRIKQTKG